MFYREQYDRLMGGIRLIYAGNECNSTVAPSDFDRLISGYRLIWGYCLSGDPWCGAIQKVSYST